MRQWILLTAATLVVTRVGAEETQPRFKLSGELRARAEGRTGFNYQPGNDDAYALSRIRVNIDIAPVSWFEAFFQGQDSRVGGIDDGRPLTTFKDPFDIRQAYIRLGKANGPVRLTVGRQLLNYGAQRVLGPLDWTNTSRNWDAIKLELGSADNKLDLFASSVVQIDPDHRPDRSRRGYNIHGAYGLFRKLLPASSIEPYLLWKTGNASIWSAGMRVASLPGVKALRGLDYQIETILQWGTLARQDHRAWAMSLVGGRTIGKHAWKPRVSVEYNYATGDRNPTDNTRRTFDHLLGTNHLYYGLVDAVGWQNIHNVRIGADAKPTQHIQFNVDYHWLWLASPNDSLYDVAGRATVRPKAGNTARSIGTELDATIVYSVSRQWKTGGGVGRLFAGDFLRRNSGGSGQTFPYAFAQYLF